MMHWLKIKFFYVKAFFCRFFGRSYAGKICGHKAKLFSRVNVKGEILYLTLKKDFDYCPDCLAKMAIKCAWCGGLIVTGDPITLYTPAKKDFVVPDHAVVYKKEPLQLVGCLRWDCADSGIDRSGFWVAPGKVHRVASPMEMVIAGGGHGVVICNDLSDISEAIPLPDPEVLN